MSERGKAMKVGKDRVLNNDDSCRNENKNKMEGSGCRKASKSTCNHEVTLHFADGESTKS